MKDGREISWLSNLFSKHCVKTAWEAVTHILSDIGPVLTLQDLCKYLKVHQSTVYRLIKAGQLPAFKVGKDWRFNREEIDRWRVELEKRPNN